MGVLSKIFIIIFIVGLLSGCGFMWISVGPTYSTQNFQWAVQLGETNKASVSYLNVVDSSGNIYVGGETSGDLPTCNGLSANCSGSSQGGGVNYDYFISKYNDSGSWVFTIQLGETAKTLLVSGMATDSSGDIYLSGYTTGNLPSCNGVSASCVGNSQGGGANNDYFISKYSSSGTWIWTIQLGETGKDTQASGLAVDSSGNIYISGQTQGYLPSCNGVSASCVGSSQGGGANYDYFVSKYASTGAWLWTQQLGETGESTTSNNSLNSTSVDPAGNVYVTGSTSGNLISCNGVSASCVGGAQGSPNNDYFILKYSSTGTWLWTQQLGETAQDTEGNALTTDPYGNVYVTGLTSGNLLSCNGISTNCVGNSQGGGGINYDYFVSKYTSTGAWGWTQQLGETAKQNFGNGVSTDSVGYVYVTGQTSANLLSCNGVSTNCVGNAQGPDDLFISKYGSSGNWIWTKQLGETAKLGQGFSIAFNSVRDLFLVGVTTGNLVSCNGISASCSGSSQGTPSNDYFLLKY